MPTATVSIDYSYEPSDCEATLNQRVNRQITLCTSDLYRYPDLGNIMMLTPILDSIEQELDITIWVTSSSSPASQSASSLRAAANIDAASSAVVLAQRMCLTHPPSEARELTTPDSFPAVSSRTQENSDHYPDWTIGRNVIAGKVAPNVVTIPWWYSNAASTPEQLAAIHTGLRDAISRALDPEFAESLSTVEQAILATQVESLIANRSTEEINKLRREVPEIISNIADYEERARRMETRLSEIKAQLTTLEDMQIETADLAATAKTEISHTFDHPLVTDLTVDTNPNRLTVFTAMLPLTNMRNPDQHIDNGGEYRITIEFGPAPHLSVRNLTRRIGSYDHPHISDGNFCLGDQRQLLDALISRSEISGAVSLTIDLLKQVNPDDTYTQEWTAWFELDETELANV